MPNEFTINFNVSYASTSGSGLSDNITPEAIVKSQTSVGFHVNTQSVSTSSTTLDVINDADAAGYLYLQNLDSDNSVMWGSTLREFTLAAGDIAWVKLDSTAAVVSVEASTGTVKVFAKVYEK